MTIGKRTSRRDCVRRPPPCG